MTKLKLRLFNSNLLYYKSFKQFSNLFIAVYKFLRLIKMKRLLRAVIIFQKAAESSPGYLLHDIIHIVLGKNTVSPNYLFVSSQMDRNVDRFLGHSVNKHWKKKVKELTFSI